MIQTAFVAILSLPLLFFLFCALYLWRLMWNALPGRARVAILTPSVPEQTALVGPPGSVSSASASGASNAKPVTRFILLLPAHNEELLLGAALDSLYTLDYSRANYEVLVIADNCNDDTAQIARTHGALALERFDKERVGKGYALEDALVYLEARRSATPTSPLAVTVASAELRTDEADDESRWKQAAQFEAVVILDADTQVSRNLLAIFDSRLQSGERIVQARYDVLNAGESWRTRLMTCALALAHVVKPLGRERLGLSDGLKGNGMCFAREVVEQVPWSGESITEDIEYTLRACRAGYRVGFAPEAAVWAQMPTTGGQAASQRQRWEGGRYQLLFKVAPRLLREARQTHSRLLGDRAMELIVPPFAEMFAAPVLLGLLCGVMAKACHWPMAAFLAWSWLLILGLQASYLLLGMWIARIPASIAFSLFGAPFYIIWKFGVYAIMAAGRSTGGWKRTERHELNSKN